MIESRRVHSITGWGPMPRWFACALMGSLCAAVAGACGGDRGEKIFAPDAGVGTYSLETIQNKSLPATLIDDNGYTQNTRGYLLARTAGHVHQFALCSRDHPNAIGSERRRLR